MTRYRYLNNPVRNHPDDRDDWTNPADTGAQDLADAPLTAEEIAAWDEEMLQPMVWHYPDISLSRLYDTAMAERNKT